VDKNEIGRLYRADFPEPLQRLIQAAVRQAYHELKRLMASRPELSGNYGKQSRGDLINFFVGFHLQKLFEDKAHKVANLIEPNSTNTERHLVFQTPNFRIFPCQLHSAKDFPRHADFRQNKWASNEPSFFPYWGETELHTQGGRLTALLIHGWKTLDFLQFVIPHYENSEYLERFDLLAKPAGAQRRLTPPSYVPGTPIQNVPDLALPKLRKRKSEKKEDKEGSA